MWRNFAALATFYSLRPLLFSVYLAFGNILNRPVAWGSNPKHIIYAQIKNET